MKRGQVFLTDLVGSLSRRAMQGIDSGLKLALDLE